MKEGDRSKLPLVGTSISAFILNHYTVQMLQAYQIKGYDW